ncbi:hypothetical protein EIL50_00475 [bacterium NHP-B]|nr:hypothetical protein EIL50_00475 [bacterium NHP-B]
MYLLSTKKIMRECLMRKIVSIGMVSALLLGASLNLAAVEAEEFGPGPWGELKSVSKYPNDGPLKLATELYNQYGNAREDDLLGVGNTYAEQKEQVAAANGVTVLTTDTMTARIGKTGLILKEDPAANDLSLYEQVEEVNGALGGAANATTLARVTAVKDDIGAFGGATDAATELGAAILGIKTELQRMLDNNIEPEGAVDKYTSMTTLKEIYAALALEGG